jgi:hypothetical protein
MKNCRLGFAVLDAAQFAAHQLGDEADALLRSESLKAGPSLARISLQVSPEASCVIKSPRGIDTSSRGQRPRIPGYRRSPGKCRPRRGRTEYKCPALSGSNQDYTLFRGPLPPAVHVLPFQGNRNESATSVRGEKSGLALRMTLVPTRSQTKMRTNQKSDGLGERPCSSRERRCGKAARARAPSLFQRRGLRAAYDRDGIFKF